MNRSLLEKDISQVQKDQKAALMLKSKYMDKISIYYNYKKLLKNI